MLSKQLIEKIKLWPEPKYRIAIRAGLHPSTLSKWIIGAQQVAPNDKRIFTVAKIIGLKPEDVFESDPDQKGKRHVA